MESNISSFAEYESHFNKANKTPIIMGYRRTIHLEKEGTLFKAETLKTSMLNGLKENSISLKTALTGTSRIEVTSLLHFRAQRPLCFKKYTFKELHQEVYRLLCLN